jgi:hypothetical protein
MFFLRQTAREGFADAARGARDECAFHKSVFFIFS